MLKSLSISSSRLPKAFILCLCLIIILQAGIYLFFIENNPDMKALDKLLHGNSKNVDYIFIGDSRIRSNINEEPLNKIKNLEFVNMGMGGAAAVAQYFILKEVFSDLFSRSYLQGIRVIGALQMDRKDS